MQPLLRITLGLSTLLVLATFAWLCTHARAQLDDYMIAVRVTEDGLWGSQVNWYCGWHGKYSGMLAMSLFAWCFDIVEQYWVAPALILCLTLASLLFLVRRIAGNGSRNQVLTTSAVALALCLAQTPEPQETLFWMTGAYAYQMGIACAIALIGVLASPRRGIGTLTGAVLLSLAVAGSSETLMLPAASLAGLWMIARLLRRCEGSTIGWCVSIALLAGGTAMLLAPGNALRGAHFDGPTHDLKRSLGRALEEAGEHIALFGASPAMIGAALLFASPLCAFVQRRCGKVGAWHFVLWYLLLTSTFVPAFWATGYGPPPRAMAPVWFVFALGWMLVCVPLAARVAEARSIRWSANGRRSLGAALLAAGLIWPANTWQALRDLGSGEAAAFAQESLTRDRELRSAIEASAATERADNKLDRRIPPLSHRPPTLFVGDLSGDPAHGLNLQAAFFFGVDSIAVK